MSLINNQEAHQTAKEYRARSADLLGALAAWSNDIVPDAQHKRNMRALIKTGERALKKRDALPTEPHKLRQHVETMKQRAAKLLGTLEAEGTLGTVATYEAIAVKLREALENCEQFIAIYSKTKDFIAEQQNAA